jgi:hypothetical protein
VTGRTELKVFNTNPHGGALNRTGIPVVFVNGNVSSNAFYLAKPIDTGFFDYDLHFVPTGSGFFELRSHPGGGAHILPHVVTVTHDVFQLTAETCSTRAPICGCCSPRAPARRATAPTCRGGASRT